MLTTSNSSIGLIGALIWMSLSVSAHAQTILPPSSGPCVVNGSTAVCEGDLSAGVEVDGSVIDHLIVQNLTQNITPAFDVEGIDFRDGGAATGIMIDADLGRFGISVDSEPAIYIVEDGAGDVVVNFKGDVVATNIRGGGIIVLETGDGGVTINHEGDISTSGSVLADAIYAETSGGPGSISITHEGDIQTAGETSDGIQAEVFDQGDILIDQKGSINTTGLDAYGILADTNDGLVSILNEGDISSTSGEGIFGYSRVGDVVINSTGNVSAGLWGIAGQAIDGNVTINSVGDITSQLEDGIEAYSEGGNVSISSNGNVLSNGGEGIDGEIVDGDGNITIVAQGAITAEDETIDASIKGAGNGNITVLNSAVLVGQDIGIDANIANDGAVTINNFGNIDAVDEGLRAGVEGTGAIYIANHGDVLADVGILVRERFDVAAAQVVNSRRLESTGTHALDLQSDGNDVLNLLNGTVIVGALDFGNGNDGAGGTNPDDIDTLNIETGVSAVLDFADTGGTGQGDSDLESAPETINYDGFSILLNGGTRLATIDPTIFAHQDRLLFNLNRQAIGNLDGGQPGFEPEAGMARLWGKTFGGLGHVGARTGTSAFTETEFGAVGGFENNLNAESGQFGLFAGVGQSNFKVGANDDHTRAEGIFGGAYWTQDFNDLILSAQMVAGVVSNQTERYVNGTAADGAFWGQFFAPTFAVTMPIDVLDQRGYIKGQIGYSYMHLDGYDETGGPAPLSVEARHVAKLNLRGEVGAPIELSNLEMNWRAGVDGVIDAGSSQVNATLLGTDIGFNGNLANSISGFVGFVVSRPFADGQGQLTFSGEVASSLAGDLSAKASAKAAVNF
ncbi:autotransporter domain-containing protein [Maritalea myrionectae]|uniref:autotransporter domain-containing protein n=1 Tax=Maritalea myrionectae TaxID=454601 RepID=UPI0009FD39ED|nr:autotransporter domain-containing protein [Maritalea myrionectae]